MKCKIHKIFLTKNINLKNWSTFCCIIGTLIGIIISKELFVMTSRTSCRVNKNPIKKKLSFFEGGHQLEKLEFALAVAQTKGDADKSQALRKKIFELGEMLKNQVLELLPLNDEMLLLVLLLLCL